MFSAIAQTQVTKENTSHLQNYQVILIVILTEISVLSTFKRKRKVRRRLVIPAQNWFRT